MVNFTLTTAIVYLEHDVSNLINM